MVTGRATAARHVVEELGDDFEVQVRLFDEKASLADISRLSELTANGPTTSLARGVDGSLGEDRPQGQAILLLSDGIDTSSSGANQLRQAAEKAKALSTPVFVRTIGGGQEVRDLNLALNLSQELAFAGQQVPIVVRLAHTYPLPQDTRLTLSRGGEEVESRTINVPAGGEHEEVFYISDSQSGLYRYQITAAPLAQEVTDLNNTAALLLRVVDEPVSVLLLEGKPYWDTKFLIRTLAADPSLELTSVVQMAPGRFLERQIEHTRIEAAAESVAGEGEEENDDTNDEAPAAETRSQWKIHTDSRGLLAKDRLDSFQIVVLGRDTETYLNDESVMALRSWLQNGDGSLVCFRGSPASQLTQRLGSLMPVRWTPGSESRFRVSLTSSGEALEWLPAAGAQLTQLPSLATSARPEEPTPLATVLATASGDGGAAVPLITYRPEGNGRVVVVEGAGMWRWAFLPPEHQNHDAVYGTLWRSLVRWLVANVGLLPSERVALRPDAVTYRATQPVTATLLLREASWNGTPSVEVTGETLEKPLRVTPLPQGSSGIYRVNFGLLPEGHYTAAVVGAAEREMASAATAFDVTTNLQERLDILARPGVMAELARLSGGAELASDDPEELRRVFQEHHRRGRPDRVVRTAAWDRWWILLAVCGLWGFTWGFRRWSGLI